VRANRVRQVIFTFSMPARRPTRLDESLHELGLSVSVIPRLFEKMPARLSIDHVGGLPLISVYPSNPTGWRFAVKYRVERVTRRRPAAFPLADSRGVGSGGIAVVGTPDPLPPTPSRETDKSSRS